MPFGCTICLVSLEKCPTWDNAGPYNGNSSGSQYVGISAVPCGHIFHTICITQWMHCGEGCPYCREPFREQEIQELFYNKLDDEIPAVSADVDVDAETDIETLRRTVKTMKLTKQLDETVMTNLRTELSRVNSRWSMERTQAEKQKDHLRLSLRNQERKLADTEFERDMYRFNLEDSKRRLEDMECVLCTERLEAAEAAQEILDLKTQKAEVEEESLRLLEQNKSLNRRIKDLRDIDQLINHRVEKRLKLVPEASRRGDFSDSDSLYASATWENARTQSSSSLNQVYRRRKPKGKRINRIDSGDEDDMIQRRRRRPSEKKRPMVIDSDCGSSSDSTIIVGPKRRRMNERVLSCSGHSGWSAEFWGRLRASQSRQSENSNRVRPSHFRHCNRRIESDFSDYE